jgi:hypothetical protein
MKTFDDGLLEGMTERQDISEQRVLHIFMQDHGRLLSTRPAGKKAAREIERIARSPGDLLLDFEGVEAATPPFLQELVNAITSIVTASEGAGRIVVGVHMNEDVGETLRYVTARAKRGMAYAHGRQVDILEDRPHLADTLRAAQRLNPFFTAPELAKRLDINPDAATQRLKKLVETGAAVREVDPDARQGVRHRYRVASRELVERARRSELVAA